MYDTGTTGGESVEPIYHMSNMSRENTPPNGVNYLGRISRTNLFVRP
jgi:hypothetical protein